MKCQFLEDPWPPDFQVNKFECFFLVLPHFLFFQVMCVYEQRMLVF